MHTCVRTAHCPRHSVLSLLLILQHRRSSTTVVFSTAPAAILFCSHDYARAAHERSADRCTARVRNPVIASCIHTVVRSPVHSKSCSRWHGRYTIQSNVDAVRRPSGALTKRQCIIRFIMQNTENDAVKSGASSYSSCGIHAGSFKKTVLYVS